MPTGISIFLIAVGAILYFAVTKVVNGLNLGAVGVVLMIVGALGLVVSLVMLAMTRARATRTTVVQGTSPVAAGTTVLQQDAR
jgi:membrane-bound ClpP family serine protease